MNILICDDVQNEIDKLTALLVGSGYAVNTAGFVTGDSALQFVRSGKPVDVCFLDIVMPEMSGIDLADELRAAGFNGEIIFLTISNDFAHESYKVRAFDYLLKPPTPDAVREVLGRITSARKSLDTSGIKVKTKGGARFLLFREISFAEVIDHKIYFRMTNGGSVEMTATFAEIATQLLCDRRFAQCHKSYIVNINDVASIIGREIIMRSGARIPLSRSYADLKMKFMDMGLEGGG